jgi:glycosyltransferase involved in cell wall biosynthesis
MRIGMILDNSFPPDIRVENEALSLIKAGHEVILFSLDFLQRSNVEWHQGIQVVRYAASPLLYKLSALAYTFPFYQWRVSSFVKDFIKRYDVQVLHVHDMVIAASVFSANRDYQLPVVLDLHENRPEIMKEYKHVHSLQGRLLINLRHWSNQYYSLAKKADRVVVVTEAAKNDLIQKTGKSSTSIIVVPNAVKPAEFLGHFIEQKISDGMAGFFNLLYIGDTSLRRGTDTAIRALSDVIQKIPNVKLWLVGKSSADRELISLAKKLGVSDYVSFEGWQHPSLLPSYVQSAHVALSPLKRNLHHDTTFANKVFQYMVCSKPIIVSDSTTQAELVLAECCGLVHKAHDPKDLAEKILSIYSDPTAANDMGKRGKEAVMKRWNWDQTVKPLLSLYNSLLEKREE